MIVATTETGLEARVRNLVHGALFAEEGHWADSSPVLDRVMDELRPVIGELAEAKGHLAAVADCAREWRLKAGTWPEDLADTILKLTEGGSDERIS